jgi:hypothetical protein
MTRTEALETCRHYGVPQHVLDALEVMTMTDQQRHGLDTLLQVYDAEREGYTFGSGAAEAVEALRP